MTNPEEEEQAALSRALRGNVSGTMVPRDPSTLRPPTPAGVLGPRADNTKRRKSLDKAEEDALS